MKTTKRFFITSLFLFITIFFNLILYGMTAPNYCHNQSAYSWFFTISQAINLIQQSLLLTVLFLRLHKAFNNTRFALSKCTIISWITYGVLFVILFICGYVSLLIASESAPGSILFTSAQTLLIIMSIWLVILFIYKLIQTHKSCDRQNNNIEAKLVALTTKTAILCFASLFCIILTTVMIPLVFYWRSIHLFFLFALISIVDIYSNFLCILLSFSYFNEYYQKLCGCCHNGCYSLWSECFHKTDTEMMAKTVDEKSKPETNGNPTVDGEEGNGDNTNQTMTV